MKNQIIGKYLLVFAGIVGLAKSAGIIQADGTILLNSVGSDTAFASAVEALLKEQGLVVPAKLDQILQYALAQSVAIAALLAA